MRRVLVYAMVIATPLLTGNAVMTRALADSPPSALKVSFTINCNNPDPSICDPSDLGGEWGEGTLIVGGTGEIQVTFEDHMVGGPYPGGTLHLNTHVLSWSIGEPGTLVPDIVFDDYYSTFVGHGKPTDSPECFLGCPLFTIIPAVPGQYDLESFFGITPAPGFSFAATVKEIH